MKSFDTPSPYGIQPRAPSTPNKAQKPVPAEKLWTAVDVASYLQASRSWVYMKAEAGQLPCLRIHGLLRFDPAAIKEFAFGNWKPQPPALRRNKH